MRTQVCTWGLLAGALLTGCGQGSSSYSILPSTDSFQQSADIQNTKIDILWVIDNSGSMSTSQQNLVNNFPTFIQKFLDKHYDFHMAVVGTDAWSSSTLSRLRDGAGTNHSGVYIMDTLTPNLSSVFMTNALLGINGNGDERMFQSMQAALDNPWNAGFLRQGSFLSVISITDEDDFSNPTSSYLENQYSNPNLYSIQYYVDYLSNITSSNSIMKRFNFNSIAINTTACLNQLNNGVQKIGQRVGALADATSGVKANLCGQFANELSLISDQIIKLSTQFYLGRVPIPETIQVIVDGAVVPATNWVYNAVNNSIVFNANATPAQGANIQVKFDPAGLSF